MKNRITLFAVCLLVWLLLVWPFGKGSAGAPDVLAGVVAAAVTVAVMREISTERADRWLNPVRWFWAAVYLVVLAYYIVRANLDVAYRVLHPAMPIRPGIVRVRTRLKGAGARTLLANSITLTPGTLSVEVTADGEILVHWINVTVTGIERVTERIVGRFEWFISRIAG
ncbi:MAG TPA: cation:proton antiporter [Kiritimatiellae bacterium]|nr:cation:proton antiporter [Kiritimatiellia bacterium]